VPRLIVLNGPPGCGKSTIASRYAGDHPLALNLDVDRVRGLLGRWKDDPYAAGLAARAIALAAARVHLSAGHDVVIPQFLARPGFLDQLAQLAAETRADFHELVLMPGKWAALRRFAERTAASDDPVHRDAAEQVGDGDLERMYDALLALVATRPGAIVVPARDGEIDETYRAVIAELTSAGK
jgi:predicted kinase